MLSARRRKKSKNSNYLLSLDQVDLSRKSPNFVGKVLPPHLHRVYLNRHSLLNARCSRSVPTCWAPPSACMTAA